ncbi:type VI secretion system protein TssL, long form [Achromobacter seleniivolatilans]|uniref:Type VI secretion system protein TssL, long form n=1 Tax=Achromobacter seleniivolatilans TaxID=3047478 RepID=A0ABY9M223_9BURK|nr:type VI secretion system protein TssL, long form [Achromobacter sp. R39]WMD20248.1 type VI secretion system protein TssL, long form [Achromobacter sp. R39]
MNAPGFDARTFDLLTATAPGLPARSLSEPPRAVEIALDDEGTAADLAIRLEEVRVAHNPLLEAAGPLLRLLASMPENLPDQTAIMALRQLLMREIGQFQNLCDKAGVAWKQVAVARYCLCTALDEAANRSVWGAGGVWAAQGLLIAFEGEVDGGEKFFLLIGRMASDPEEYAGTLEVLYHILGLGFEGRYSVVADGHRHLEQIRQRLSALVARARDAATNELSVNWRGEGPVVNNARRIVPGWLSAAIALLVCASVFAYLLDNVGSQRDTLAYRILQVGLEAQPEPAAAALVAGVAGQAPQVSRLRLTELLKEEIARGLVKLREEPKRTLVTFPGDTMFVSGRADVYAPMVAVLERVADEVKRVDGKVEVVGYTDNQPIRTRQFPDNQALSQKRAEFVRDVFLKRGLTPEQAVAAGRGEFSPLGDNATPEGRAQNRRVELYVTSY